MTALEYQYPRCEWLYDITSDLKSIFADQLIAIVSRTYSRTRFGSFIKTVDDVMASKWIIYLVDGRVQACIFYRHERKDELWMGQKIQGIGHDGTADRKTIVLALLKQLLNSNDWWVETGGALRIRLLKDGVRAINDQNLLRILFKDPKLAMINDYTYKRLIGENEIQETSFGHPTLKKS